MVKAAAFASGPTPQPNARSSPLTETITQIPTRQLKIDERQAEGSRGSMSCQTCIFAGVRLAIAVHNSSNAASLGKNEALIVSLPLA